MPVKTPFSVVLITLNAAQHLEGCLASVQFADEILIVDSGSTDSTLDIAAKFNAKVIQQSWLGFGKQKDFAVKQAAYDWVFCIDADEKVSEKLCVSIEKALLDPEYQTYMMPRRNRFMDKWLSHGEGYPDWSLRLFNRTVAYWSDDDVHEKVICTTAIGRLEGDLLHESQETITSYLTKQNRYTTLQAQRMLAQGKRAHIGHLLFSPIVRFIKFYFFRLGFMDGIPGLIHISIGCFNSFIKYAKLIAISKGSE